MERHTRGVLPVLKILEEIGLDRKDVLKDTLISLSALSEPDYCVTIEGEYSLYRNILKLTQNPNIGLLIGDKLQAETYGIYGYALLCTTTLRKYAKIGAEFGVLSLTHFSFSIEESEKFFYFKLNPSYQIPNDLIQVFSDRDLSAGHSTLHRLGVDWEVYKEIQLMHDGFSDRSIYEEYFGCEVKFNQPRNCTVAYQEALDRPLSDPNPEVMEACLVRCRELVNNINFGTGTKSRVLELLISPRGRFLGIDEIAAKFGCSSRTLRRNLSNEGSSYAEILKEVRVNLAREYLASGLKIETVGEILGYSEAAAFSRAFKQWTDLSPKAFRESLSDAHR